MTKKITDFMVTADLKLIYKLGKKLALAYEGEDEPFVVLTDPGDGCKYSIKISDLIEATVTQGKGYKE